MTKGVSSIIANNKVMSIWDSLPIYCGGGITKKPDVLTFSRCVFDIPYIVDITPARFDDHKKQPFWVFPAEHEKSIEQALRKIYTRGYVTEGEVDFDLIDLKNELSKSGINRKDIEIVHSLDVLCRAFYDIDIDGVQWSTKIINQMSQGIFSNQIKEYRVCLSILEAKPFLDY